MSEPLVESLVEPNTSLDTKPNLCTACRTSTDDPRHTRILRFYDQGHSQGHSQGDSDSKDAISGSYTTYTACTNILSKHSVYFARLFAIGMSESSHDTVDIIAHKSLHATWIDIMTCVHRSTEHYDEFLTKPVSYLCDVIRLADIHLLSSVVHEAAYAIACIDMTLVECESCLVLYEDLVEQPKELYDACTKTLVTRFGQLDSSWQTDRDVFRQLSSKALIALFRSEINANSENTVWLVFEDWYNARIKSIREDPDQRREMTKEVEIA